MVSRSLVLLVTLLVSSAAFAGCLKPKDGGADDTLDTATTNNTTAPTSLPDGREFAAAEETNKTEAGTGGMEHKHDYWRGAEQIVIYDDDVTPFLTPIGQRGDTSSVMIGFINLEKLPEDADLDEADQRDALVFEGTGQVEFRITTAPVWSTSYDVTFRTAGKDWSTPMPVNVGEPSIYTPAKTETDMPHSFRSLWNWKIVASGTVPVTGELGFTDTPIHVQIIVHKASNVDDWPGHPAFYDGVKERIVAKDKPGRTDVQQAADVLLYGVEPDQVEPDRLVSMGTATLDVYVNITSLDMPPGVENSGFQLFWRSAATHPNSLGHSNHHNESDGSTWAVWRLQVDPSEVDSPYQPQSRFSFKVLATPADDSVVYCYRCIPYSLEYTITVIARPDPEAAAASLDEMSQR